MEEFLDGPKSENNNVVDNLEALKDDQLNIHDFVEKTESTKEQNLIAEDLLKDDEQLNHQSDANQEHDSKLENEDLLNESTVDEIVEKTSDFKTELDQSTKQLLEDLNDTANTNVLDLTNSDHSLTPETFLKQNQTETANSLISDNLIQDYSVKEVNQNVSSDSAQDFLKDKKNENITNSCDEIEENLFQKINLNNQLEKTNLVDQSEKEISLIETSIDNSLDKSFKQSKEQNVSEGLPNELNLSEKSEFFSDLNKEIVKTADDFISSIKPEEASLPEQVENKSVDDLIIKNTEPVQVNEISKSETFILDKNNDNEDSSKNDEMSKKQEQIISDSQIENKATEQLSDEQNKAKEGVLTSSQEYFKEADKLIAEKKTLIGDINIPGLDVQTDESKQVTTSVDLPEETKEKKEIKSELNNSVKSKSSRKCIIC